MNVHIKPWRIGTCSIYSVVRDEVCLIDRFIDSLTLSNINDAKALASFIDNLSRAQRIRPELLRPERPELGVYAMYKHDRRFGPYNPSRVLCAFAGSGDRILIAGAGFVKQVNQPIQKNPKANQEAEFLAGVVRQVNDRIDVGEIISVESELRRVRDGSFHF
ncbi:MAG TPA: hypothetical protein VK171_13490 [Fimbriimonas sp.]|nr:hypothetical protein [Fimbriimonas sp.]